MTAATRSPPKERLIWWTTNGEAILIGDEVPAALPDYVRNQWQHRRGWSGGAPKKLWADARFGDVEISEWPETTIARNLLECSYAGIVFLSRDLKRFADLPGLVTDFQLRILFPECTP